MSRDPVARALADPKWRPCLLLLVDAVSFQRAQWAYIEAADAIYGVTGPTAWQRLSGGAHEAWEPRARHVLAGLAAAQRSAEVAAYRLRPRGARKQTINKVYQHLLDHSRPAL